MNASFWAEFRRRLRMHQKVEELIRGETQWVEAAHPAGGCLPGIMPVPDKSESRESEKPVDPPKQETWRDRPALL